MLTRLLVLQPLPLHLETASTTRRAGGGGLPQQPKVLPPPLASARSSQPPVSGRRGLPLQTLGAFRLSWVFVRCSCEGIRLSPWPRLHPRGGVGRSWEAKEVASPRISAAGQLAQGGALWLTLKSACSSRRGSLTRPRMDQVPLAGVRVHHQPPHGLSPAVKRGGCSGPGDMPTWPCPDALTPLPTIGGLLGAGPGHRLKGSCAPTGRAVED